MRVCAYLIVLTICMCVLNSLSLRYARVWLTQCAYDLRVCAYLIVLTICVCVLTSLCLRSACVCLRYATWGCMLLLPNPCTVTMDTIAWKFLFIYFVSILFYANYEFSLIDWCLCAHIRQLYCGPWCLSCVYVIPCPLRSDDLAAPLPSSAFHGLTTPAVTRWLQEYEGLPFWYPSLWCHTGSGCLQPKAHCGYYCGVSRHRPCLLFLLLLGLLLQCLDFSAVVSPFSVVVVFFFYCWLQLDARYMGLWHSTRACVHTSDGRVAVF